MEGALNLAAAFDRVSSEVIADDRISIGWEPLYTKNPERNSKLRCRMSTEIEAESSKD